MSWQGPVLMATVIVYSHSLECDTTSQQPEWIIIEMHKVIQHQLCHSCRVATLMEVLCGAVAVCICTLFG